MRLRLRILAGLPLSFRTTSVSQRWQVYAPCVAPVTPPMSFIAHTFVLRAMLVQGAGWRRPHISARFGFRLNFVLLYFWLRKIQSSALTCSFVVSLDVSARFELELLGWPGDGQVNRFADHSLLYSSLMMSTEMKRVALLSSFLTNQKE